MNIMNNWLLSTTLQLFSKEILTINAYFSQQNDFSPKHNIQDQNTNGN